MEYTTSRLRIRPIAECDLPELVKMYLEPDSNKYIPPLQNKTTQEYQTFLESKLSANKKEVGFWTLIALSNNAVVGTVNLNYLPSLNLYHIGCHLLCNYWGKGLALEAMQTLLENTHLKIVHGVVSPQHSTSKKLLQEMAFTFSHNNWIGEYPVEVYKWINRNN